MALSELNPMCKARPASTDSERAGHLLGSVAFASDSMGLGTRHFQGKWGKGLEVGAGAAPLCGSSSRPVQAGGGAMDAGKEARTSCRRTGP